MLFNSLIFLLFALIFFSGWRALGKSLNLRWIYLVVFSFFFYGWWDWRFLFLILASGLIDYYCALTMHALPRRKRIFLVLSLLGNLGSLAVFKYSSFFAKNIDAIFLALGIETQLSNKLPSFVAILPVGISFYTFQSMSYSIDVYRGKLKPVTNIFHFFAYLSLFPQLVAGPIVRATDLLPQMARQPRQSEQETWDGFQLILYGFFFKLVIADNLAPYVSEAFSAATPTQSTIYWWGVMIAFSMQIYGDFAGYSAIALGLAKWMGYQFPENFKRPYFARSLKEFWTRWHISLSSWFRDYVYIPMGGSRKGLTKGLFFMFLTMVLSGLWHGAAWPYVFWGIIHGLCLALERTTNIHQRLSNWKCGVFISWALTMLQILIAWVFFRSKDLGQAFNILEMLFIPREETAFINRSQLLTIFLLSFLVMSIDYIHERTTRNKNRPWPWRLENKSIAIYASVCVILCTVYFRGPGSIFIYFQF